MNSPEQRRELRERRERLREQFERQRQQLRQDREQLREQLRERAREVREQRHEARRMGTRGQPEESRAAILQAAAQEFAQHGIAGARTDAIAREARVNKALLYYYFEDKETLYGAVLEDAFSGLKSTVFRVLDSGLAPRDKILAYVGAYFDFVASHQLYPRLMQREMMRAREGHSQHIDKLVKNYIQPIFLRLTEVMRQGIKAGEFRDIDPVHFVPSMVAMIVFYFSSAPMMQKIVGFNPLAPERIAARRASLLDFISAGLFVPKPNATQGARS
jgi:TetR/AcrR family transcriptional regulator